MSRTAGFCDGRQAVSAHAMGDLAACLRARAYDLAKPFDAADATVGSKEGNAVSKLLQRAGDCGAFSLFVSSDQRRFVARFAMNLIDSIWSSRPAQMLRLILIAKHTIEDRIISKMTGS